LGVLGTTHVHGALIVGRYGREAVLLFAVVEEVMDRRRPSIIATRQILSKPRRELIGIGEGHALEQGGVHDAEHRGRETDAERKCEHGNGSKRAALPQRSSAVPDVSENGLHDGRGWSSPPYDAV